MPIIPPTNDYTRKINTDCEQAAYCFEIKLHIFSHLPLTLFAFCGIISNVSSCCYCCCAVILYHGVLLLLLFGCDNIITPNVLIVKHNKCKWCYFVNIQHYLRSNIMSVIDRIANMAEKKGISQAFICKQIGVQRNWVATAKRQQSNVSDERLAIIADILGTTVEYLKGETDDPSPDNKKSPSEVDELLSQPDISELLELYRALTPGEQRKALSVLKALKETE